MPPEQCWAPARQRWSPPHRLRGGTSRTPATGGAPPMPPYGKRSHRCPAGVASLRSASPTSGSPSSASTPTVTHCAPRSCGWTPGPARRSSDTDHGGWRRSPASPPTPHLRCTSWPGSGARARAAGEDAPGPRCACLPGAGQHRTVGHQHDSADPLGLVDVGSRRSPPSCGDRGDGRNQVCDQVPTGEVIASLTGEVADGQDLERDTVVVAGLGDGQAAGLGAGVTGRDRSTSTWHGRGDRHREPWYGPPGRTGRLSRLSLVARPWRPSPPRAPTVRPGSGGVGGPELRAARSGTRAAAAPVPRQ